MGHLKRILKAAIISLAAMALAPDALAQATRTWVSGVGDDVNPCSRTAPCKTFAGAISKTADGGIIDVLDPGGFGALTITKSITIDGSGGSIAGVLASGTNGININAPGVKVILRNLDIEGGGTGLTGVNFLQGASLTIENCRIYGFQSGSATAVNVNLAGSAQVVIKDSNISHSNNGVHLETSSGQLLATLDNVRIHNTTSFAFQTANMGQVFASIRHSDVSNNTLTGIQASGPSSVINVVDSLVSFNNGAAVNAAYPGARIRISGNTIVNNNTGIGITAGATVESDGTNRVAGFTASATPNATFANQ